MYIPTYRAYNEVGWENKLQSYTTNAPPTSTFNVPPDPVSLRFVNKRNQLYPQEWQVVCCGRIMHNDLFIPGRAPAIYTIL